MNRLVTLLLAAAGLSLASLAAHAGQPASVPSLLDRHAALAAMLDTPVASGEVLTSVAEHWELIRHHSVDFIQPDAPRVGGITPMLKIMGLADQARIRMAPHFAMEIHLHLAAAYAHEPWVEHFEWLEPMFNERLQIEGGRMLVPDRPGLGFSLSDQARAWTKQTVEFGKRP